MANKTFSDASGIQGYSGVGSSIHYIVFAANAHLANHVSALLTYTFRARGRGEFTFRPMIGSYKGKVENSWMIKASDWDKVKHLCDAEESILYLGSPNSRNQRAASLIFLNGSEPLHECLHQDIGHMVEVTKEAAMCQDGYTQGFVVNDAGKVIPQYWTCYKIGEFGEPIIPERRKAA